MSLRTRLIVCSVVAVLAVIPLGATEPPDPLLHKPAAAFVRNDLQKRRIDLAKYKGQVILLNFWATWCAPCQIEMPRFAQWQKTYAPRGLQILAVSMDDEPAPVLEYVKKHPLPFPVMMGDEDLGAKYGDVLGLPDTFLINRDGIIVAHFKGETRLESIEAELRKLLDIR